MAQNSDFIDAQITKLITNAPDLAVSEATKAIAPVLKTIALQQKYSKYFLLQSPTGNLVLTTLSQVSNPQVVKNAIYAYSNQAIAAQDQKQNQNQKELQDSIICEYEIIPLLFQLLGMPEVDSLILDQNPPQEIERQKLYNLCQSQLKVNHDIA